MGWFDLVRLTLLADDVIAQHKQDRAEAEIAARSR